jgi:hypothetical protein
LKSVLIIGNIYINKTSCQYVIRRTELQKVLLPLFMSHNIYFWTDIRRAQYNKMMFILLNDIKLFASLPETFPVLYPLPVIAQGYVDLPFFL